MNTDTNNKGTVTIIGAGVIGRSWAAAFLAGGYGVTISDPLDGIEEIVWEALPKYLSGIPGRSFSEQDIRDLMTQVSFEKDVTKAARGAVAVQENGPEKEEFKQKLFSDLERVVDAETLLLSSSSGITPQVIGATMRNPNRVVIGHPFNPPHQLPLVEVCGTVNADTTLIERVMTFYKDLGKKPSQLKKPVPGFVANRLQTVLVMEALRLVKDGVVDIASLDQIMLNSLGPRWTSVGPLLAGHLGGGDGGLSGIISHILNHLAQNMGIEPFDDDSIAKIGAMAEEAYPLTEKARLADLRDRRTIQIIEIRMAE
ncbi:MAG: hydroxylacyl-CoA dehydrogenase [Nitrosomonas sp.]|nr:hydroxylacyl-CoA dehydrogenase [Nitrosomonas sp.]